MRLKMNGQNQEEFPKYYVIVMSAIRSLKENFIRVRYKLSFFINRRAEFLEKNMNKKVNIGVTPIDGKMRKHRLRCMYMLKNNQ